MPEAIKRPPIIGNLSPVAGRGLSVYDLRQLALKEPKEFLVKLNAGIDQGLLRADQIGDWKSLYQALADVPMSVTMQDFSGVQRAISTSAFPILTSSLGIKAINDAYMDVPTIGDRLVTEFDDPKKTTTMVAIHNLNHNIDEVKELQTLPLVSSTEESTEIKHRKMGWRIEISMEMINESQNFNILNQFNSLGRFMMIYKEKLILKRVTDYDGSKASPSEPYVYRPGGTGTALYSATANTPNTRNPSGTRVESNELVDYSDVDNARDRLNTFIDVNGDPIEIGWNEVLFLVPYELERTLLDIVVSPFVPGIRNLVNAYGPRGKYGVPMDRILTSRHLSTLSQTAWYIGAPRRQFYLKNKLKALYITLAESTPAYLMNHVAFQASLALDVEVGAIDSGYMVQNLAATTAPADE